MAVSKLGLLAAALLSLAPALATAQVQATPRAGVSVITMGGTAVTALSGPSNGCYIVNPLLNTDQGIMTAEPLYVDPTTTATTTANGTSVALAPGAQWPCIPNSSLPVSVDAATSGHKFTVVRW